MNPMIQSLLRKLTLALLCLGGIGLSAETPSDPKPGAEQARLSVWVGTWKYSGQEYPEAIGRSGKFAGVDTHWMTQNGFFLEGKFKEAEGQGQGMIWYDAASKSYQAQGFSGDGSVSTGTLTITGNTWVELGNRVDALGQTTKYKITTVFSADGRSGTTKAELSKDGGSTWILWWDLTMKRSRR